MSDVTILSNSSTEARELRFDRDGSPESSRNASHRGGPSGSPRSSSGTDHAVRADKLAERQADRTDSVREAVAQMNDYIQATQRDLRFSIDRESGETVVKVLDRQTEEVIRQIPDELFLKLARNLNVDEPVHFFNEQA